MPLFRKSEAPAPSGPPADRRIPQLNPTFYMEIHREIQGFGGTDSLEDVAAGVANAISNTAHKFFDRVEPRTARRFDQDFEGRAHDDLSAADRMLDWMIRWDPVCQETFETLLRRLKEVLSKPPA